MGFIMFLFMKMKVVWGWR